MRLSGMANLTVRAGTLVTLSLGMSGLSGCASSSHHAHEPANDLSGGEDENESAQSKEAPPAGDVVEKAARPFSGYRPVDDKKFDQESLLTHLAAADAICIGERHDQVLDHYAQLRVLQGLAERREIRGFELGLALEMVRTEEQPTLKAYAEERIDVTEFQSLSGWREEWGFPIQYYEPQMDFARRSDVALIGLGVPKRATKEIAQVGFAGLDELKRSKLPEVNHGAPGHRELFDSLMEGHPMDEGKSDNYYDAQLMWDEKMAEVSAAWISQRAPGRKLVIMAGTAHCHRTAIPDRIRRRTGVSVVSLLPVEDDPQSVSDQPSSAQEHVVAGYDYQMVFTR